MKDSNKQVGTRLKSERKRLSRTLVHTSALIKVTDRTFSRWESGRSIPSDKLLELKTLGFDIYYVLTGSQLPVEAEPVSFNGAVSNDYAMILIDSAFNASRKGEAINPDNLIDSIAFKKAWLKDSLNVNHENLLLKNIEGDSMEPTLRPGDLALIDSSDSSKRDGIYLLRINGVFLVRRIQRFPSKIKIICDNPLYESFEVNIIDKGVEIIGRVIWTGKNQRF